MLIKMPKAQRAKGVGFEYGFVTEKIVKLVAIKTRIKIAIFFVSFFQFLIETALIQTGIDMILANVNINASLKNVSSKIC